MKPLVSIVMPAYNAEKFIREAIDSILNQSFCDFELIILNDGSTDRTQSIIESYVDARIKLINKENSGVASTLNMGLKESIGEFIWRHDADDVSLPEKLERQLSFLESNPDFSLCATQVAFMTERGKVAWSKRQPKSKWLQEKGFREVLFEDFSPYSPITHGTVLFRKSILSSVPHYREAFITSEDIDMWLRMMEFGKLAVINECLSLHRLSTASATAIHGWKNEFYREKAKEFYKVRGSGGQDELEKIGRIIEPPEPFVKPAINRAGRRYRGDLLSFQYTVAIDASDWFECARIVRLALRDGGLLARTYRSLIIPILAEWSIKATIGFKRIFNPKQVNG